MPVRDDAEIAALREAFPASAEMFGDAAPARAPATPAPVPEDRSALLREAFPASPMMWSESPAPSASPASSANAGDERARWAEAARADAEIGGANLPESIRLARAALAHGDAEIASVLETTGLGNHPAVIRLLARLGRNL